jgi:hypothetical protein
MPDSRSNSMSLFQANVTTLTVAPAMQRFTFQRMRMSLEGENVCHLTSACVDYHLHTNEWVKEHFSFYTSWIGRGPSFRFA